MEQIITEKDIFQRTELLLGEQISSELARKKVLVVGVGGVGSWCAEGLLRSGIRELTVIDSDEVSVSNINRQLIATSLTIGRPKVEVLKERLLQINPYAHITALQAFFLAETDGYSLQFRGDCADNQEFVASAKNFNLSDYDYVVDAIDSLKDKAALILAAADCGAVFFSSMGSALKVDPTRIKVGDFWKVRDCPLGAALRKRLRQRKTIPANNFLCVYSDELLVNQGDVNSATLQAEAAAANKAVINGTTAPITAIFGMTLAGLVIKDIYNCNNYGKKQ